jgi:hypothetical protein
MTLGFQRGQLLAPQIGTAAGHHHGGIPSQNAGGTAEGVKPSKLLFELVVRRKGHERSQTLGESGDFSNRRRPAIPRIRKFFLTIQRRCQSETTHFSLKHHK